MHLPSSMSNNVNASTSVVFFAATAANFATTGNALSGDTFEQADRLQQNVVNSTISNIIYSVSIRDITSNGTIEYSVFKIERANAVPTADGVTLPNDALTLTQGLQSAVRQF